MQVFEDLFLKSKGKPIDYNGKVVAMIDEYPVSKGDKLKVVFEGFNSEWKQGVHLKLKGKLEINGQKLEGSVVLWQDTAPREVEVIAHPKKGPLVVKNVWDTGDGVMQSWHNGAALIVEPVENGRRYLCNDGHPDENFDDIVFSIVKLT